MSVLTREQYKVYRDEWEMLSLRIENKAIDDGDYYQAKDRLAVIADIFQKHFNGLSQTTEERVARVLTRWLNGKRHDPLPDWDSLPLIVKNAYLEQAKEAIEEMKRSNSLLSSYL